MRAARCSALILPRFLEQHRVHHLSGLAELEYEMTHWDPDESDWSPNRLDALVWAVTWLADLGRDRKIWFA